MQTFVIQLPFLGLLTLFFSKFSTGSQRGERILGRGMAGIKHGFTKVCLSLLGSAALQTDIARIYSDMCFFNRHAHPRNGFNDRGKNFLKFQMVTLYFLKNLSKYFLGNDFV